MKGNKLEVGDVLMIPVKVLSVQEGADYCNVTVETVEKMHPGEYKTVFTLNGKQATKVHSRQD
jgi:hypothetical protein